MNARRRRDLGSWRDVAVLVALGAVSGVPAGLASFVFLEALDAVTRTRVDHAWLVWTLPLIGFVVGYAYHHAGGRARGGTALAVAEARDFRDGTPGRMAPMVLVGTLLGHLGGASVGREGTAIQMSSSLTEAGARAARLGLAHRRALAQAALAGGFGGVFGVPVAGAVFAIEASRRRSVAGVAACVAASFVAHGVVIGLGHEHTAYPVLEFSWSVTAALSLVALAAAFGLAARIFAVGVGAVRRAAAGVVSWVPGRPVLGGVATLALALLVGRDHLGLSLPLIGEAFAGQSAWWDPVLKVVFTVIALGTGFVGGEVTPLFVIGATLGSVLSGLLDLAPGPAAGLGLVAVFGAAAHVPLACAVMAVELFGWQVAVPALVVCLIARRVVGRDGIYDHHDVRARVSWWASRRS